MAMTSGRCLIILMIFAFGVSGCANAPLAPTPEVRKVLAPTGTLRLGLSLGTPGQMIRDPSTGEVRGIGYELGREFAKPFLGDFDDQINAQAPDYSAGFAVYVYYVRPRTMTADGARQSSSVNDLVDYLP